MKLEEVLPAMREGRVAKSAHGTRFMIERGDLRFWDYVNRKWTHAHADTLLLDGWTLEPEPKVDWPKGSLQWAETEANRRGLTYIKRRNFHLSTPVVDLRHHIFSDEARHALDWEVVP